MSGQSGNHLATVLTRSVVRAFYETRHVLIIECILNYSALRDDDLAYLVGMNTKDLHKLCAKLKEDRLLEVQTRPEVKEGQSRPVNRTYYWIDFQHMVDAVKWRVYKIDKDMQGTAIPASERKEYFCNFCKASWTQMEVLDSFSAQGFICHRCKHVLVHDAERHAVGHQKSTRMNNQFKFITDLLPQIDAVGIPEKTFEEAYSRARVVVRADTHQTVNSVAVETGLNRPTAVKGLANMGPTKIEVNISTGDGPSEEEKRAEQERKERLAAQNAMPVWYQTSATNPKESFVVDDPLKAAGAKQRKEDEDRKAKKEKEELDAKEQADLDDYMARLKAEQAAEAARKAAEEEEEYESGDEDEGDFEDVVGTSANNSAVGTPASTAAAALGAPPVAPSPLRHSSVQPSSSLKREAPGSGTSTEATSPNGGTPPVGGPPAKKMKTEEDALAAAIEDEEEDEDLEFEDV